MEEKTEVTVPCSPKQTGEEESCGDSVEICVRDDKNAAVDGGAVPADLERSSPGKMNKKVIKHALRQQAKRRRKNTTIAAGGGTSTVPVHRATLSPLCELEEMTSDTSNYRQPTMAEVLSSIPGFNLRVPSRKRSNKKMSAAAQIEQTREGCVDLESPDSILANTNLRQLLNKHTFLSLPQLYQYKLLQLLPHVDRIPTQTETMYRLSNSALNNEFFARACLDWRERLAEGEFTPENQAKLKAEQEKEKSKLDPWKLKHFEPMWGESLREWPSLPPGSLGSGNPAVAAATPAPSTPTSGNKKEPAKSTTPLSTKTPKDKPPLPVRTVGAVTRAVTSYREKKAAQESTTKIESSSPTAQDAKEVVAESTLDSTIQATASPKDKKDDKIVMEPVEEKVDVVVESETVVEPDESNFDVEPFELQTNTTSVCESVQTDSIVPDGEIVDESLSMKDDFLNTSRKRGSSEILDVLAELPESVPTEPKRRRSEENEEVVAVVAVEACEADDADELVSNVVEMPNDALQLEMHDVLQEDSSPPLAMDSQEVDSNIRSVDDVDEIAELDSSCVNGVAVRSSPKAEDSSASSSVDLVVPDRMHLSKEAVVDLPLESELNESLEVAVRTDQTDLCAVTGDHVDYEVDKTLVDLVDLQEEVADRQSNQSVKAEALNKSAAHLEEWEIIKVDPNDVTSEVACSTAGDSSIPASVSSLPGLSAYGNVLYQEDEELKEDEAALLAAAWDVVGSSSEFQHQVNMNQPVSVIPCQEELEVRLQESSLPAPQWDYTPEDAKCQPQGHVKLELEVTLTPEVDSSTVTSTSGGNGTKLQLISGNVGGGMVTGVQQMSVASEQTKTVAADGTPSSGVATTYGVLSPKMTSSTSPSPTGMTPSHRPQQQVQVVVCSNEGPGVTVIPPTTIVCLPPPSVSHTSTPHPPPHHHHHHHRTTGGPTAVPGTPTLAQSSSALPFIALTTSTPVRALVTKPVTKSSGRSGRNNNNNSKPPPGAVNLERSYQICQAVIQNSPNRHQLRCQLKPPPSLLGKTSVVNPAANRVVPGTSNTAAAAARGGGRAGVVQQPLGNAAAPTSRSQIVFRHVFASSAGGIPVNMAVLPSVHQQVSEVMRGLELRRSNSAPPHSAEATRGVRPPSAPPLPPPFASSVNAATAGSGASNCSNGSCSLKAMIACVSCGAFCHDDCLASPTSRLCMMCCDTR